MITDIFLRARTQPFLLQSPIAKPLPGLLSILSRPTPGGSPLATNKEAVTPMKKVDYTGGAPTGTQFVTSINFPVRGHTYVTNPRKDATTPRLRHYRDTTTAAQVSNTGGASAAATVARNVAKAQAMPATTGNDTGRTLETAPIGESPSGPLHWVALLVIAGIAFFVLRK